MNTKSKSEHFHEIHFHDVIEREREDALDGPRVAWCAGCDAPIEIDEHGNCPECADDFPGEELALLERLPPTSPRSIECPTCGEDRGAYCRVDDDGNGYNHAARVERFNTEQGIIS